MITDILLYIIIGFFIVFTLYGIIYSLVVFFLTIPENIRFYLEKILKFLFLLLGLACFIFDCYLLGVFIIGIIK